VFAAEGGAASAGCLAVESVLNARRLAWRRLIATRLRFDAPQPFAIQTSPPAAELGRLLETSGRTGDASLQLGFGDRVAGIAISDLWSTCCELLLQAQLVRERKLDHFVLDVEQIFELIYEGDCVLCVFSTELAFLVDREQLASALEQVAGDIFAGTSCPRLMQIAASWGAFAIRGLPYAARFSESALT
jgi:hypothetical protein